MRLKYYLRGLGIGIAVTALVLAISGNDKAAAMTDEQIVARAKELGMQEVTEESAKEAAPKDKLPETVTLPKEILPKKETADALELEKLQSGKMEETKEKQETNAAAEEKKPAEGKADASGADIKEPVKADAKEPSAGEKETQPKQEPKEPVKTDAKPDTKEPDVKPEAKPEAAQPAGEAAEQPVIITINRGDSSVTVSRKAAEAGLVTSAAEYDAYLCRNGYDKRLTIGAHEIPAGATQEEIAKILTSRKN